MPQLTSFPRLQVTFIGLDPTQQGSQGGSCLPLGSHGLDRHFTWQWCVFGYKGNYEAQRRHLLLKRKFLTWLFVGDVLFYFKDKKVEDELFRDFFWGGIRIRKRDDLHTCTEKPCNCLHNAIPSFIAAKQPASSRMMI